MWELAKAVRLLLAHSAARFVLALGRGVLFVSVVGGFLHPLVVLIFVFPIFLCSLFFAHKFVTPFAW